MNLLFSEQKVLNFFMLKFSNFFTTVIFVPFLCLKVSKAEIFYACYSAIFRKRQGKPETFSPF